MWSEVGQLYEAPFPVGGPGQYGRAYTRHYVRADEPGAKVWISFYAYRHTNTDGHDSCAPGTIDLVKQTVMVHGLWEEWMVSTLAPTSSILAVAEEEALRRARTFDPRFIAWNGRPY